MSHREKVAWLSLIAMAVAFGPYFVVTAIATSGGAEPPVLRSLAWFGIAAVAQMLLLGAGHWYLRRASPSEARAPADKRDRAIDRRSVSLAYYVLIAGVIVVGVVMPFNRAAGTSSTPLCWR